MTRKKILWLVSWYPNRSDKFDGDFIQRHARAAAIKNDIHVIFVKPVYAEREVEEEWNYVTGLTEQLIYFRRHTGLFGKWKQFSTWQHLFRNAVKNYISKNGLPDCVHVHIPWKAGLIGIWIKKKYHLPYIISEHWGIYDEKVGNLAFRKMLNKIYDESGALVTVSRYLASAIEKTMNKKTDAVLPNVVDTSLFHVSSEKYSKFTFIHVSNMAPVKNVAGILEAFRLLTGSTSGSDIQLIMIGNRNNEYVKMADAMGLLNISVFFRGEIPYVEVAEEMKRSHCLVLFSNSETFSCVTAEALCSGISVIVPNTGALPELVNENNGILIIPGDIKQLRDAMETVLSGDKKGTQDFSGLASKQYGYQAVSEAFASLYSAVCGEHS